jgi:AcrR family transcriptional regulator
MNTQNDPVLRIVEAALRLASNRPWHDLRLSDVASEAGMSIAELSAHVSSRMDILRHFARHIDHAMLESLARDPVDGEPHDRLFEVLMRRLEVMAPYRAAVASIMRSPLSSPADIGALAGMMADTQGWVLAAARLEDTGLKDTVRRLGLASVYGRTLKVWIDDDDPGLARTMAALDTHLREGAATMRRLEPALALGSAFASLARGLMWNTRRSSRPADREKTEQSGPVPPSDAAGEAA